MEQEAIQQISERILEQLKGNPETTAWDLKVRLKLPNSDLYMALGYLLSMGRLSISPDGFTHRVRRAEKPAIQELHGGTGPNSETATS